MKKTRGTRSAVIIAVFLLLICFTASAENLVPPSPEPPAANMTARPTPAPTAVPTETIVDHVHQPELYPDFSFQKDRKLLEIWFPNIKDADMAVLLYDGQVWMIDCGDKGAAIRGVLMLKQIGIQRIDVLFNSHLHHDHIDGLAMTDDTAKVGEIRICFAPDLTSSGLRMLETADERSIPVLEYRDGDCFTMGDGAVTLQVFKNNEEYLDMNNQSAVMRVAYGQRSILFTADMEQQGQEAMLGRIDPCELKCDIVKYPHHAKSEMYEPFYQAMGAGLAVATSVEGRGDRGQYYLFNKGIPTVYTSTKGVFTHLVTDGRYWLCEQIPVTAR